MVCKCINKPEVQRYSLLIGKYAYTIQSLNNTLRSYPDMTSSNNTYRCEECDTTFDNENDFLEHKNYAKFRREGTCWQ